MDEIFRRHEELKKRIHNFRIPLSPTGQRIMSLVYLSLPIIGGYLIMQQVQRQSEANIGVNGSKLTQEYYKSETKAQNDALQELLSKAKNQRDKST